MKKLQLIFLTIFILTLTACGSVQTGTDPASVSQSGTSAEALPAAIQLSLGTLKLEDTAQAVTADQAEELLPLWQTMLVLVNSDTAAQEEKEALIAQIEETMTSKQKQAIAAMNLSRADLMSLMQQHVSSSQNNNSQRGNSSEGGASVPRGDRPPDGMPMPGGGLGFGGGQNLSADQIATAQAARQANTNSIPPALLNAVIEYLQEKAGS